MLKKQLQHGSLVLGLLMVFLPMCLHASTPADEYKLKAALIYKLSKFVEWPDTAQVAISSYFDICLLGSDAFGRSLDVLEEYEVKGKQVRILRFNQSEGISSQCNILFISESKTDFLDTVLQNLKDYPTLTLSDAENFARRGGMIQFHKKEHNISFKVNLAQTKRARLRVAAPLLELSTIVATAKGQ